MERLQINETVLRELFADAAATQELADFLNSVIDDELEKGDGMDCDLVDACVDALEELQNANAQGADGVLLLLNSEKFLKEIKKHSVLQKNHQRVLAVASAAAVLLLVAASAHSKQTTGDTLAKRIEQKIEAWFSVERVEPSEPTETQMQSEITTVPAELPTVPETGPEPATVPEPETRKVVTKINEPTPQNEPVRIYGIYPEDLKTEYKVGETLDMHGVRVMTVLPDGTERELALADCDVTTPRGFSRDPGKYPVTVFYKGLSFSYTVTVYAEKDTVILNSIYGTFSEDFSFTVQSFDGLDFSGMTVTAVYSDGSTREIPLEDCEITVEPNFMELENKALVTVSYEERAFSFILTKEAE